MGKTDGFEPTSDERERLLTAALAEFGDAGVERADNAAIATRAGLTKIPDDLADRADLLRAVLDRFLTVRDAAAEANLTLEVPPGVFLPRVARAILGFFAQPQAQAAQRVCTTEAAALARLGVGVVRERPDNVFRLLSEYFRLQIERGTVADIEPEFAARVFLGLVWAHLEARYFLTFMTPSDVSDEEFIDRLLPLLLNGLLPRP